MDSARDRVFIFDTTLRDGEQSPGSSMNQDEKLRLARQLEKLGVLESNVIPGRYQVCRTLDPAEGDEAFYREKKRRDLLRLQSVVEMTRVTCIRNFLTNYFA